MYRRFLKRLIDIVLSFVGLIVLALPMAAVAIAIKLDSNGPVLFKQKRVALGTGGANHFFIYKFRTMKIDAPCDMPTHLLGEAESHITKVGAFLRKTSIDELPQLLNILRGQMSIVGPRPALWNQFDLIAERDKVGASEVKPGLTGWAQINGRDQLDVYEKARLDGEYASAVSFAFDAKCFFRTFGAVLPKISADSGNACAAKDVGDRMQSLI